MTTRIYFDVYIDHLRDHTMILNLQRCCAFSCHYVWSIVVASVVAHCH